jgi:hypothetical protein
MLSTEKKIIEEVPLNILGKKYAGYRILANGSASWSRVYLRHGHVRVRIRGHAASEPLP